MRALAALLLAACAHTATDAAAPAEPRPPIASRAQILAWGKEAAASAASRAQLGDFRAAIEFQRYAITVQPTAEKFFVLAEYYRDAGELRHAAWVMGSFVKLAPTHPRRREAERLIEEWRSQAGQCSAVADEPADPPPSWTVIEDHRP